MLAAVRVRDRVSVGNKSDKGPQGSYRGIEMSQS